MVFGNFRNSLCRGDRGGGLLEKMISFFFTMTENSCNSRMQGFCSPPFGKLLGNHCSQVVLSIKALESHTHRDALGQSPLSPSQGRQRVVRAGREERCWAFLQGKLLPASWRASMGLCPGLTSLKTAPGCLSDPRVIVLVV